MGIPETRKKTLGHINQTKKYLSAIIKEIESRAKSHDNSALYSPEIDVVTKHTEGSSQDFIYDDCLDWLDEITQVLNHHYENNPHHIESFENGIEDMTLVDLIIMVCDWMALFSKNKTIKKDIQKYITKSQEKYEYSDEITQIFFNTIKLIEK